jgi:hypothetical protein
MELGQGASFRRLARAGVVGGAPGSVCGAEPGSGDPKTELATRRNGRNCPSAPPGTTTPLLPDCVFPAHYGVISHRTGHGLPHHRRPPPRRRPGGPLAPAQMAHDPLDHLRLRDEGNSAHLGSTPRTHQRFIGTSILGPRLRRAPAEALGGSYRRCSEVPAAPGAEEPDGEAWESRPTAPRPTTLPTLGAACGAEPAVRRCGPRRAGGVGETERLCPACGCGRGSA